MNIKIISKRVSQDGDAVTEDTIIMESTNENLTEMLLRLYEAKHPEVLVPKSNKNAQG